MMSYRPPISRRQFLKLAAVTIGTTTVTGTLRNLLDGALQDTSGTDGALLTSAFDKIVPGVCLLCPSGCGVLSRVADGRVVKLEGSPMHPINLGALCPKGQATPELLYNPDRLTGPLRRRGPRGSGEWEAISWQDASKMVATKLNALRAAGQPERAALLYGQATGHLPDFLARFMKAVGSPNLVSRESLNVAAAKMGAYLTQGVYDTPVYDLENSNYVITFGASLLEAGPVPQRMISGFAFLRRGRSERGKVVVIDPRQGVTGAKADEWIPIVPGTDAALALSMANVIIRSGLVDPSFVNNYSFGYEDFPDESRTRLIKGFKSFVLENYDPADVAEITGISAGTITRLAGEFATNRPAVAILPGKGGLLNGSIGGVYTAMAVHALNALVGSLDVPGGVLTQRYPIQTPWPPLPDDPVAAVGCGADRVDGAGTRFPVAKHAFQAVADEVLAGYPLEFLLLYDANPVFEVPGGERFKAAFEQIPLVVAMSSFMDESAQYADLVLPEPTFLERFEDHFLEGLGYPGVALRQPAIPPLYDTLSIADFLLRVAKDMGGPVAEAFPWTSYANVIRNRLSNVGTDWDTLRDLGLWLTPGYRYARRGSEKWLQEVVGKDRQFAPRDGHFDFFSRELKCILDQLSPEEVAALGLDPSDETIFLPRFIPTPYQGDSEAYPFMINVITLMALGPVSAAANMPTLQEISGMTVGETWGSWLEMNPKAAEELGLHDKDQVWVESLFGKIKVKLRLLEAVRPDVVNLPYNLGHTAGSRWAANRGVNGLELLNPASEPITGLAAFTNTRVKVYRA